MIVPRRRLIAWSAVLGLPLATVSGAVPAVAGVSVGLLVMLATVVICDALWSYRCLDGLALSCPRLLRMSEGRNGELELRVRRGEASAPTLRLALLLPGALQTPDPEIEVRLPATEGDARLHWSLGAKRRGHFRVESCRLQTASRFGFWEVRREAPLDGEVRVYPDLSEDRRSVASIFLRRGGLGAHAQRQVGKGKEFEKLRDYVPGDSYDDIHWKASGKRGHLVTKEFQIERTQEVYVVLDASRLSARPIGGKALLERTLRAALVLALATRQHGDLFGLITFSDRVRTFLPARAGKGQYDACREALFSLHPSPLSPDFGELATFIRLRLRRRALLVFLTDLDDPALAEDFVGASELIGRHHLVLACMLRPPQAQPVFSESASSREEIFEHLAGHLSWHRLRELGQVLEHRGVNLAILERETLAADVVGRYVAIKRRQIL